MFQKRCRKCNDLRNNRRQGLPNLGKRCTQLVLCLVVRHKIRVILAKLGARLTERAVERVRDELRALLLGAARGQGRAEGLTGARACGHCGVEGLLCSAIARESR